MGIRFIVKDSMLETDFNAMLHAMTLSRGVNEPSLNELCVFKLGSLNFYSNSNSNSSQGPKLYLSSTCILTEPSPSQLMKL